MYLLIPLVPLAECTVACMSSVVSLVIQLTLVHIGNSAEKLQAQVSSVIKDNIRFQEELRQKDQQISSCKV